HILLAVRELIRQLWAYCESLPVFPCPGDQSLPDLFGVVLNEPAPKATNLFCWRLPLETNGNRAVRNRFGQFANASDGLGAEHVEIARSDVYACAHAGRRFPPSPVSRIQDRTQHFRVLLRPRESCIAFIEEKRGMYTRGFSNQGRCCNATGGPRLIYQQLENLETSGLPGLFFSALQVQVWCGFRSRHAVGMHNPERNYDVFRYRQYQKLSEKCDKLVEELA